MFLTTEILEKHNACAIGKKWFARYFPEGAEMIDIINSPKANIAFLHWGFENLTATPEELAAYWDKLNITNCDRHTIIRSHNVDSSDTIIRSQDVNDSSYIFSSKKVKNSCIVNNSSNIEDSHNIFDSSFVYNSYNVLNGKNVNDSHNVLNSSFVVNSHSVFNADNVTDSFVVFDLQAKETKDISNCGFIANCERVSYCLFCTDLTDKEYYVFNRPISKAQYEMILRQLKSLIGNYEAFYIDNWGEKTVPLEAPHAPNHSAMFHSQLPDEFWEWVKTLPGYDPKVLYQITFNPNLIDEF